MATRGIWVGGTRTPAGYDEFQKDIADIRASVAAVQSTVVDFIAKAGSQVPGNVPTLPSNLTDLLARIPPDSGTPGQVWGRTANGYAWINLPVSGTTPVTPTTPTVTDDFTSSFDAVNSLTLYMRAQAATLT